MAEEKYYAQEDIEENSTSLRDFLYLCLNKWYWFLLSFAFFWGLAVLYILTTPKVYTRTASVLIKDDKQSSMADQFGQFSDFGFSGGKTNLYNEKITFKSPNYMLDVVKDLHLDMNYSFEGPFHSVVLYGSTLPITVTLPDLNDEQTASLTVELLPDNKVRLSKFYKDLKECKNQTPLLAGLRSVVMTPVGRVVVNPTQNYIGKFDAPINVSRVGFHATTKRFVGALNVDLNDDKASVLDLKLMDENRERADDILNELFTVYNRHWVDDINEQAISTAHFIDEELHAIESELGTVDQDISSYKSEHLMPDLQKASELYLNKSAATEDKLLEYNNQLFMAKYIENQLSKHAAKMQPLPANSGVENGAVAALIANYNETLVRRNNLMENSSPSNPIVIELDQELAASRSSILSSIRNVIATLQDRVSKLQGTQSENETQLASNPNQQKYLLSVERQQKVKEQLYIFLLQKREENQLSKAFTAYNTKMLNPPDGSERPSKPVRINIILIATVLALLMPMLILLLINSLDTAVHNRRDLEMLTLPFIGEIPLSYKRYHGLLSIFNKKHTERKIVVQEKNSNEINEAFRVVRTNLEFVSGKNKGTKTIMFTSANAGSGKTFVSMNLATSFAIKGKRTLVVDLDIRKASLSTFVKSPKVGISDYLSGRVDKLDSIIIKGQTNPNLDVIPVGTIPPNPTELLFSEQLEQALDSLHPNYDYIFIDCPPVEIVADASIINKFCDMTVFVIRSGMLDKHALPDIQQYYDDKRYKNLVVILNGTEHESNGYGYGYHKYGYSYSYGYGYGNKS